MYCIRIYFDGGCWNDPVMVHVLSEFSENLVESSRVESSHQSVKMSRLACLRNSERHHLYLFVKPNRKASSYLQLSALRNGSYRAENSRAKNQTK